MSYTEAARDVDVVAQTVHNWVTAEKKKRAEESPTATRGQVGELERRIRELEQENAFLKSGSLLRERTTVAQRYACIAAEKAHFDVALMCRLMGVSRSGFYDWERRTVSAQEQRRGLLIEQIHVVFAASKRTYGYRCGHAELVRGWSAISRSSTPGQRTVSDCPPDRCSASTLRDTLRSSRVRHSRSTSLSRLDTLLGDRNTIQERGRGRSTQGDRPAP
ncbi:hypothetical protein L1857_26680 [Amycolatopsis thermalba]|uniref:Transposase n=1 Tax=Amycolatopsis thermalba TaxID=944492 RepID=A0ABY4P6L5_9PSEU|nr:hypothetical protein L1857_26680 [Amycolatopsis thermalba]